MVLATQSHRDAVITQWFRTFTVSQYNDSESVQWEWVNILAVS